MSYEMEFYEKLKIKDFGREGEELIDRGEASEIGKRADKEIERLRQRIQELEDSALEVRSHRDHWS